MIVRKETKFAAKAVRNRAGFSLLEVLVVVAIIVMLAGVGGYYVLQRYGEAQESRALLDARRIAESCKQYQLKTGEMPGNLQILTQPVNGDAPLEKTVRDPWGKDYQMQVDGFGNPVVSTTSPRGKAITSADNDKGQAQ
jgi:general secretion pathway protein G